MNRNHNNDELEEQYKYKNEPMKQMIKKAEKKIEDKKKPIDPKYIFVDIKMPKHNKKKYRKPDNGKNELEFDKMEDMIFH